jgi:hypothetical protein
LVGQVGTSADLPTYPALNSKFVLTDFSNTLVTFDGTAWRDADGGLYGVIQTAAAFTTSQTTISVASNPPAWLANEGASKTVYDITTAQAIGTVSSVSGATITLSADASHAGAAGDRLLIHV